MTLRLGAALTWAALITMGLAGLAPGTGVAARAGDVAPLWGPYITRTTETGAAINWKTEGPTWGVVQYATEEQYTLHGGFENSVVDSEARQLHQVSLEDLEPAEAYRYRVWILGPDVRPDAFAAQAGSDVALWLQRNGWTTREGGFRTLGGDAFTFIVYGDTQEQTPWFTQMDRHKLVADYIAQEEDVAFVVHLGDFTYDADDVAGWDAFFEAAREMLANNTLYPVIGNHENNSPVYDEIFGMPQVYRFRSGAARFLVLDTNSWADYEAQKRWLQDELSAPSQWDFVFYHHPAYSSDTRNYGGWELSRSYWEDVLVEAGVTAVFSGHVHAYERYRVRGLNHFVVGTGGGALADLSAEAPAGSQNRLAKTLGYARVTVDHERVVVSFIKAARVSDDNRQVLEVYPFGSVLESVTLEPGGGGGLPLSPEGEFRVSPVSLRLDVDRGGSRRFNVRITSSRDAQVYVDTEDLPFDVQPTTLQMRGSEQAQRVELELFSDGTVPDGEYQGKITFLCDAGTHVALGVKVGTTVTQTGQGARWPGSGLTDNLVLIVAVVVVAAANAGGYVAYRKYKARIDGAKDAREDE